jgi:heat shock protein HslJ
MNRKIFMVMIAFAFTLFSCNRDRNRIVDKEWIVESIRISSQVGAESAVNEYVLSFNEKHTFSMFLDVNTISGEIRFKRGKRIEISDIATTLACCDSDFAMNLVGVLAEMNQYELNGNQLRFFNSNHQEINFVSK